MSSNSNYPDNFNNSHAEREIPINFNSVIPLSYNEEFSMEELLIILGKVRGTSTGPDGIKYDMVR